SLFWAIRLIKQPPEKATFHPILHLKRRRVTLTLMGRSCLPVNSGELQNSLEVIHSLLALRQNLVCFLRNPHYGSLIYADGHGEVWTDWNSMSKFFQYGWRCSTNENSYSNRTLIGNWNQERYDLKNIVKPKPLPSEREPHWFPGHQPELDPPHYKCTEKSTFMNGYSKPLPTHYS
ncbi:hypothetical protein U0070_019975, partial [Myodes glareolus]